MHSKSAPASSLFLYFGAATILLQALLFVSALTFRQLENYGPIVSRDAEYTASVKLDEPIPPLAISSSFANKAFDEPTLDVEENVPQSTPSVIKYVIKRGDTFSSIWAQFGESFEDSHRAAAALKEAGVSVHSLRVGEELEFTLSEDHIQQMVRELVDGRIVTLSRRSEADFDISIQKVQVNTSERRVSGAISSSLAASASDVSLPLEVLDDLVDLFDSRIDFRREVQPGDIFSVIYSENFLSSGKRHSTGPIMGASVSKNGKMFYAVRHDDGPNGAHYYDEAGQILGKTFLKYPLKFSRISSMFTGNRFHPVLKVRRPHLGVDFAAPIGTPVRSVADGVVIFAGYDGGHGLTLKIRHGERYTTDYCHLSKIITGLKPGARVTRGEVIGSVGMSGLATGPHLHFGLFDRGRYVDPLAAELPVVSEGREVIPAHYLTPILEDLEGLASHAQEMKMAARLSERKNTA